ncbi:twin-arginine translocase TatA/TatE family subunit [bacterium]|nr:twin-arginine translocase TatA/TatE family subunit [bacterium]
MLIVGFLGTTEVILIFVAILLVFGPAKLPALAKALGQSIREFKSSSKDSIGQDKDDRDDPPTGTKK